MSEPIEMFERAVAGFGRNVAATTGAQWHDPTPCTEWDVRTLVNHLTVEQLWVRSLVDGATVAEVGDRLDGDQLGDDPVSAWNTAVAESSAAFGAPGALDGRVTLSYGPRPTVEYCWEMTVDALIHTWDLARGIGADETLDGELVALAYERTLPFAELLAESGLFDPPVPVEDSAPLQTKLLALVGRRA